jgi:integrase
MFMIVEMVFGVHAETACTPRTGTLFLKRCSGKRAVVPHGFRRTHATTLYHHRSAQTSKESLCIHCSQAKKLFGKTKCGTIAR